MPQNTTTLKSQLKDVELTSNVNYLQPTGFRISIDRTRYPNLEYFVQEVSHPSMTVNSVPLSVKRLTSVPIVGDKITFSSVEFSVLLDEDMTAYREMFDWMQRGVNDGQVSAENRRTAIPTYSDITLSILSSHNNSVRQITYKDCIPTDLGAITFNSTGDGSYLTFSASFAFSQFEIK